MVPELPQPAALRSQHVGLDDVRNTRTHQRGVGGARRMQRPHTVGNRPHVGDGFVAQRERVVERVERGGSQAVGHVQRAVVGQQVFQTHQKQFAGRQLRRVRLRSVRPEPGGRPRRTGCAQRRTQHNHLDDLCEQPGPGRSGSGERRQQCQVSSLSTQDVVGVLCRERHLCRQLAHDTPIQQQPQTRRGGVGVRVGRAVEDSAPAQPQQRRHQGRRRGLQGHTVVAEVKVHRHALAHHAQHGGDACSDGSFVAVRRHGKPDGGASGSVSTRSAVRSQSQSFAHNGFRRRPYGPVGRRVHAQRPRQISKLPHGRHNGAHVNVGAGVRLQQRREQEAVHGPQRLCHVLQNHRGVHAFGVSKVQAHNHSVHSTAVTAAVATRPVVGGIAALAATKRDVRSKPCSDHTGICPVGKVQQPPFQVQQRYERSRQRPGHRRRRRQRGQRQRKCGKERPAGRVGPQLRSGCPPVLRVVCGAPG